MSLVVCGYHGFGIYISPRRWIANFILNSKGPLLFSKNETRIIPSNKRFSVLFTPPDFLRPVRLSPTMSQLSDGSPPQYESHHQSQDNILITVIQNEKSFREWARKMRDLNLKVEKFFESSTEGDLRSPKGLEDVRQGSRLFDEMTDCFKGFTNIPEERISHGQNELYDTMEKLSDTELDRFLASSKLGTTSHRQRMLTWNHKKNIDGYGNFKYKPSRAQVFFHAIQGVWEHLKGRPV